MTTEANDPPVVPQVSIADVTVDEDAGTAVLTVTLSEPTTVATSVAYASTPGTAGAGDFTAAAGTLAFAPGETSATITLSITDDTATEDDETFTVALSGATGLTIADGTATVTIEANDPPVVPQVSIADVTVDEDAGVALLTVTLSEPTSVATSVDFATVAGSASAADFVARSGTLTFAAGETTATLAIDIVDDTATEGDETFTVALSGADGLTIEGGTAAVTIQANDPPVVPHVFITDAAVDEDAGKVTLAVTLSEPTTVATSLTYATAPGTAGRSDYTAASGVLAFAAGVTAGTITIAIADDTETEGDETFSVVLSDADGLTIDDGTATVTIAANDPPIVPEVSIADLTVDEDAGTARLTVTLGEPTTVATSVSYATAAGTAGADDFTGAAGTLTFAAGETSATVAIAITDDTIAEADESFTVTLSEANGLRLADDTATVTIAANDVAAEPPTPSIAPAVAVQEGDPIASGWLSTSGSDIVDSAGNVVTFTGVNWYGAETARMAPDGLDTRHYTDVLDQMKAVGFNSIRLPFSNDTLREGATPQTIDYSVNPELEGLDAPEVIDAIIAYAGEIGLRIILDNHRNAAGDSASANGLWYGEGYTQQDWIDDWEMLAERYKDDPTVAAFDLSNEPHAATWGTGDPATDWRLGAESAIEAVHAINPEVLVVVEGIGGSYWWGGNLTGVADAPVRLDASDKLVYSAHVYPNSLVQQSWFSDPAYPANLEAIWDENFGYIAQQDIAPVLVGEFGFALDQAKDALWLSEMIPYLADNGLSFTYWAWNSNSHAIGGILTSDWITVNEDKLDAIAPVLGDLIPAGGADGLSTTPVQVEVTLAEPSAQAVTVYWATADGTAVAGVDYIPDGGIVTFAPGATSATVEVEVVRDTLDEGDEDFFVFLTDPGGAPLPASRSVITITDDDDVPAASPQQETRVDENGDGFHSEGSVRQAWNGGYVGDVFILNETSTGARGWTVELTLDATIRDIWNAQIVSQVGNVYTISNIGVSASIPAEGEAKFGFVADGMTTEFAVSDVILA
ncbi:cellulase family glycosylhydrolase [Acuticoccus sp. I52.16.1]|nr:cellulase family glycosylhydrolase [Acuticoccus sp. I52.16.1]